MFGDVVDDYLIEANLSHVILAKCNATRCEK